MGLVVVGVGLVRGIELVALVSIKVTRFNRDTVLVLWWRELLMPVRGVRNGRGVGIGRELELHWLQRLLDKPEKG